MSAEIFQQARDLIQKERYADARQLLNNIDHPKAREWMQRIDELDPPAQPAAPVKQPQFSAAQLDSNTIAIPGLQLDITGLNYDMKPAWWAWLFVRKLRWNGFIPLRDITTMEYTRIRVLRLWQAFILLGVLEAIAIGSILLTPVFNSYRYYGSSIAQELFYVVIAFLITLALWLFWKRNSLLVYSHGDPLLEVSLPRSEAESLLRLYRFLRAKTP